VQGVLTSSLCMCSGCDAYALAIVVWELVTLLRPFSDTPEQVLSGAVGWGAQRPPLAPLDEAVAEQRGEVASAVREAVVNGWAQDRHARWALPGMYAALELALGDGAAE